MTSEPDVSRLWREQPREGQAIAIDDIRARSLELDRRIRRRRVPGLLLFVTIFVVHAWLAMWPTREPLQRLGDVLTVAALIYVAFEYRRHLAARPDRAGLTSCVEFYRAQMAHEHDLSRQSARYLLPFVPGVILGIFGRSPQGSSALRMVVFAFLGVALFLGVAWWNHWTARRLQRQLDAVEGL